MRWPYRGLLQWTYAFRMRRLHRHLPWRMYRQQRNASSSLPRLLLWRYILLSFWPGLLLCWRLLPGPLSRR
jgi:hypothetical protein